MSPTDELPLNLNRDQFTYTDPGQSRKRVEAVRDLLEEACRRHWAYQVTSTARAISLATLAWSHARRCDISGTS